MKSLISGILVIFLMAGCSRPPAPPKLELVSKEAQTTRPRANLDKITEPWQKDPVAFAELLLGGNIKDRPPTEAGPVPVPEDVTDKIIGARIKWDGIVEPGEEKYEVPIKRLSFPFTKTGKIWSGRVGGYHVNKRMITILEQTKDLPLESHVRLIMVISEVSASILANGAPEIVLGGFDARVDPVK